MQFSISKRYFLKALNHVSHAISANSPVPALSGIKIELTNDQLILTASDSNMTIVKTIDIQEPDYQIVMNETGAIVLESKYLLEMIRRLDGDTVKFDVADTTFTKISGNAVEYKINGIPARDYPDIDIKHPLTYLDIDAADLMSLIHQTTFAVSKKEQRPVLTGVNFRNLNGMLTAVGTDSYRLSQKQIPVDSNEMFNVTIPARVLDDVDKIIENPGKIRFYISDRYVQFAITDTLVQSRLIDGSFPETDRLIPSSHTQKLTVKVDDLMAALDRCAFIRNDGMAIVKMSVNADGITIASRNQEVGSSNETVDYIRYEGDPIEIAFSGDYARDAIRALNCDTVVFLMSGEMKAFLIENIEFDHTIELLLPVRTYN